jgi:hypothetical protein
MSTQRRRNPRALTLTLPDTKQPYLIVDGRKFTPRNISEEGIGIWVPEPLPEWIKVGTRIKGNLQIGTQLYPVELEMRHHGEPRVAGLHITHKSDELSQIFHRLLEPATYAAHLEICGHPGEEDRKVGYNRLWYTGSSGAELIIWYNGSQRMIIALQITWLSNYVFRHQFIHPHTGHLHDHTRRPTGHLIRTEELLIEHDPADAELLQQAAQFLVAVPLPIPGHLLWQFLETGEQVYLPSELFEQLKVA